MTPADPNPDRADNPRLRVIADLESGFEAVCKSTPETCRAAMDQLERAVAASRSYGTPTPPTEPARHFEEFPDINVDHIPLPTSDAEYLGGSSDYCPTEFR